VKAGDQEKGQPPEKSRIRDTIPVPAEQQEKEREITCEESMEIDPDRIEEQIETPIRNLDIKSWMKEISQVVARN